VPSGSSRTIAVVLADTVQMVGVIFTIVGAMGTLVAAVPPLVNLAWQWKDRRATRATAVEPPRDGVRSSGPIVETFTVQQMHDEIQRLPPPAPRGEEEWPPQTLPTSPTSAAPPGYGQAHAAFDRWLSPGRALRGLRWLLPALSPALLVVGFLLLVLR
jgi:hypothetical protein